MTKLKIGQFSTIKLPIKTPLDLTGYIITSGLKEQDSEVEITTFDTSVTINPDTNLLGLITLLLPASKSALLKQTIYEFDIRFEAPAIGLAEPEITFTPKVQLEIIDSVTV